MFLASDSIRTAHGTSTRQIFPVHPDMKIARTPSQCETPTTFPITSPELDVTVCTEPFVGSSARESPLSSKV